jgi:hypothetical protein
VRLVSANDCKCSRDQRLNEPPEVRFFTSYTYLEMSGRISFFGMMQAVNDLNGAKPDERPGDSDAQAPCDDLDK